MSENPFFILRVHSTTFFLFWCEICLWCWYLCPRWSHFIVNHSTDSREM